MLYEYLKLYIRTAGLDFTSFKLYIILVNKFLNLLICVRNANVAVAACYNFAKS